MLFLFLYMQKKVFEFITNLFGKQELTKLEKETIKRNRKKRSDISKEKERKPSKYIGISNRLFSNFSMYLIRRGSFKNLPKNLVRANLEFLPKSYISVVISTTILSFFIAFLLFVFFMFFNIGVDLPILTFSTENFAIRFLKTFLILFAVPIVTFMFMYSYPSLEKDNVKRKIDLELPFTTIHMSAIAGSLSDPTKIFSILVMTK